MDRALLGRACKSRQLTALRGYFDQLTHEQRHTLLTVAKALAQTATTVCRWCNASMAACTCLQGAVNMCGLPPIAASARQRFDAELERARTSKSKLAANPDAPLNSPGNRRTQIARRRKATRRA